MDETRFTGCILHGAHTRATQEVPKKAISEQNIRIPMSPFRSFICPESFHKIAEARGSSVACARDPNCDLLGRHPDHASASKGDCQDFQYVSSMIGELGISYQTGEVLPLSNSSTSILRSPLRFQQDDHCSTDGEGSKPSDRECQSIKEQKLLNAPISCNDWQNESNVENRYQPGSLHYRALQRAYIRCLHQWGHHTRSQQAQVSLDSQALEELEWWTSQMISQQRCSTPHPANRYDNRDGCLDQRLGRSVQRHKDGREVEHQRKQLPYQLPRTESGISGDQRNSKKPKGGTRSPQLATLAMEIWTYCLSRQIWITAKHLSGLMNSEADYASRNFNNHIE